MKSRLRTHPYSTSVLMTTVPLLFSSYSSSVYPLLTLVRAVFAVVQF